MIAFYSRQQAKLLGLVEYATASGGKVVCSSVRASSESAANFDDIENRGEVTTYIRRISSGILTEEFRKGFS